MGLVALLVFGAAPSAAYSAPKTVLVLGDSLSAEYGLPRGAGWVALLERRLQAEKLAARIVNASISGDTTAGGRARLPALLLQVKPDLVVVELGGNDGLRGLPVPAAEANLGDIITRAKAARAKVLLVGMQIPPNYAAPMPSASPACTPRWRRATRSRWCPSCWTAWRRT